MATGWNEETRADGAHGSTEQFIAAIWSQLLDVGEIDPRSTFVALGGDSIAAVLCLNRIKEAFGQQISLTTFLEADMTLARLASLIESANTADTAR